MKKILILILVFIFAIGSLALFSSTAAGDYHVQDGILYSFTGLTTTVRIPADVYYIADFAFKDNTRINRVIMHDNVKIIGNEAFYGCTALKTVEGTEGVAEVGAYAFHGTPFLLNQNTDIIKLNSVVIGGEAKGELYLDDSVRSIAPYAFAENTEITSVKATNSLTSVGEGAFYRCTSLKTVDVGRSLSFIGPLAFYSTRFTGEYSGDFVVLGDGILVEYRGNSAEVILPETLKRIGGGAFYYNTDIQKVSIPEGVTSIDTRAFMNCTKLSFVAFPQSLKVIGDEAFAKCKVLDDITIPEKVEVMGESIFYGCKALENVSFKNLTNIPKGTFSHCSSLKVLQLPVGITSIGEKAFENCTALTDIAISEEVTEIGEGAFSGADNLTVSAPKGSYAYEYCENSGVNIIKAGDANYDNKLNIRDATAIQKHTAGVITLSFTEAVRADANFDGKINVRDATYIQKILAGMI